jgi:hypothetical protein
MQSYFAGTEKSLKSYHPHFSSALYGSWRLLFGLKLDRFSLPSVTLGTFFLPVREHSTVNIRGNLSLRRCTSMHSPRSPLISVYHSDWDVLGPSRVRVTVFDSHA